MKRLTAIALIAIAPGLLTFAVALGCLYSMPACHMSHATHPCCATDASAGHNIAVRYASFEIAPPVIARRAVLPAQAALPSVEAADVTSFASPPPLPLRV